MQERDTSFNTCKRRRAAAPRGGRRGLTSGFAPVLLAVSGLLLSGFLFFGSMAQASDRTATASLKDGLEAGPPAREPGRATGLPVPRFVSLKSGRANVRRGPGTDFPIDWVYRKNGVPLEIIAESNNWRRIRDHDGDGGWIWHTMLAGERSIIVEGNAGDGEPVAIHTGPDTMSDVIAYAQKGLVARVTACDSHWCHIDVQGYEGWARQSTLWGVYPGEAFE
ncbi:MAG: SH3 domain-containing protein [Parvibaculum sp.]|nr:SH3 domain-containing protein [Parvibaculum sp.]